MPLCLSLTPTWPVVIADWSPHGSIDCKRHSPSLAKRIQNTWVFWKRHESVQPWVWDRCWESTLFCLETYQHGLGSVLFLLCCRWTWRADSTEVQDWMCSGSGVLSEVTIQLSISFPAFLKTSARFPARFLFVGLLPARCDKINKLVAV